MAAPPPPPPQTQQILSPVMMDSPKPLLTLLLKKTLTPYVNPAADPRARHASEVEATLTIVVQDTVCWVPQQIKAKLSAIF